MRAVIASVSRTVLLLLALEASGCFNRRTIAPVAGAQATVSEFMDAMVAEDRGKMKLLLSPAWMAEHNLDSETANVNLYFPVDYELIGTDGPDVKVRMRLQPGTKRDLWFRVVVEDARRYILPGAFSNDYIHPWQKDVPAP